MAERDEVPFDEMHHQILQAVDREADQMAARREPVWGMRLMVFAAAVMLARCSGEDRYYKFLDVLFEQQPQWAFQGNPGENLEAIAKQGGFSAQAYEACIQNEEIFAHVRDVQARGQEVHGVRSTPTFFVNGEKVEGALPFSEFEEVLLKYLPES